MSKINRSVYQKVCEENKRLLKDLRILTYAVDDPKLFDVFQKWNKYFEQKESRRQAMVKIVKRYIQDHKDELPDFLTKNTEDDTKT